MGRSLLWQLKGKNKLLVFKFAKNKQDTKNLLTEVKWLKLLKKLGWVNKFEIPGEITINDRSIFNMNEYRFPFISFFVSPDYFYYPNGLGINSNVLERDFLKIISKSAKILGKLTGSGIIHTAVIPLFHNRTRGQGEMMGGYIYGIGAED